MYNVSFLLSISFLVKMQEVGEVNQRQIRETEANMELAIAASHGSAIFD